MFWRRLGRIMGTEGAGGRNSTRRTMREIRHGELMTLVDQHTDDPEALPALLRPSEVAARLGVSRTWLYDAAKEGRSPSVRLGGADGPLRFVSEDLRAWIEASRAAWRRAGRTAGGRE
jgi:excisionase family DNA binding protein